MSGETVIACCCAGGGGGGTTGLYLALKCNDYFSNYCCLTACNQSPDRINFCPNYLLSIGIPVPPVFGQCYIIGYDCCAYYLSDFEDVPCPPAGSPYPTNVGWKIGDYPSGGGLCCIPYINPKLPVGEIGLIFCDDCGPNGAYVLENNEDPCHEFIADCYNLCDQHGLAPNKKITISSTISVCVVIVNVPWFMRCQHGPSDSLFSVNRKISQEIASCVSCDSFNGTQSPNPCPPVPFSCPEERRQEWTEYCSCEGFCPQLIADDCCGGINPCDFDPLACDALVDMRNSYEVKTCYSIQDCEDNYHVEDVLTLQFDACLPLGYGVDPTNQGSLENWVNNSLIEMSSVQTTTCWGDIPTFRFRVCGLVIDMVSGTIPTLVTKINTRIGALINAIAIAPWSDHFWFGTRQTCEACPWDPPCTRPAYVAGDVMQVGAVVYDAATGLVSVTMQGVSIRKSMCVAQSMNSQFNCRGYAPEFATVCAGISATGAYPFVLQCLSLPEYANGERYAIMNIEEPASMTTICVAPNTYVAATECTATVGYPLDDITQVIGGVTTVITAGYRTVCPLMPEPRQKCRCYPFIYTPAPCCTVPIEECPQFYIENPLPEPCVLSFQNASIYCETSASGKPDVAWCVT